MSKVVIFGTGSFAEVVHFYLTHDSPHEVVAFTAHQSTDPPATLLGLPVVPYEHLRDVRPPNSHEMFVAVGYRQVNSVRARIYGEVKADGYRLITYISSRCTHWGDTKIGDNCFVFEDNTIQPYVTIGNDVIVWSGNHIGHHASIGDHAFLASHIVVSGHVRVGQHCFIGVNATLRDNITIADRTVIGAGTIVMKSTRPDEVYIAERTKRDARKSSEIGL